MCCFILAKSTENSKKRKLATQRELLKVQRFERIAALERRIFEHAFAAFDQVEQSLAGTVQVQALPPSPPGAPPTPQAGPKDRPQAITAKFQTLAPLDARQATESEDAERGNGKRPFRRGH